MIFDVLNDICYLPFLTSDSFRNMDEGKEMIFLLQCGLLGGMLAFLLWEN